MLMLMILQSIADVAIVYYVAMEYYESRETNKALTLLLNKQKQQRKKISVDRIIKAATMEQK